MFDELDEEHVSLVEALFAQLERLGCEEGGIFAVGCFMPTYVRRRY